MLRLGTTLLLAAACVLVSPAVSTETVLTCQVETVQRLSCDTGVISVQEALYGRTDSETCSEEKPQAQLTNTDCAQEGTVDVLKRRCDGKRVCEVSVNVFGSPDPCEGTSKYLQTKYICLPAIHLVTCEHSFANLHCDTGQVISVYGADYGRHDQTTCTYKRPATQIQNSDCSQPTSIVSDNCGGKNSCSIKASNSVFGDPCVGTFKYLEVAYVCEYPSSPPDDTLEPVGQDQAIVLYIRQRQFLTGQKRYRCFCFCIRQSLCSAQTGSSNIMLCYRLSTTLLLAATCLLMAAVVSTEKVVTCGSSRNVQRLSCESGVIVVQAALYGRADNQTCSEGRPQNQLANTTCAQRGTVDVLRRRCDGKRECELNVNLVRNSNPCRGIHKYLETTFTCFPAIHFAACEGSVAHLKCDVGQVIFVYGADYGRRDRTTCSFRRPTSQIQTVDCSRPTTKVADSCNGKNRCSINVSNSVFGDPCGGTYKYLEVAYICEYPGVIPYQPPTQHHTVAKTSTYAFISVIVVVSTEKVVTCGSSGNVQRLSCESGVIVVQAALYGRADNQTCSEGRPQNQLANTTCAQRGTVDVLRRRCDGKRECELNINLVRNSNPCRGIHKYLETTFTCFPAIHFAACELSVAHLKCDVGQVIFVYGADYGRRDRTTCSFGRPTSQIQTVDCSRPTTIVADSCNGKNSCAINVSNSVFGDPCGGPYKYLEVTYICEYPAVIPNQH
ncbi:uncharacterized protein LOC126402147 [Epinephelus moara]|uniref:uncharacterized protein LOC126402147 n=1 Tax=Epinephelus moara TaxID=300413 RepID=UPI00214E8B2E|nr:uncharacterized protein LOC126402147 [Epinephelus moara]